MPRTHGGHLEIVNQDLELRRAIRARIRLRQRAVAHPAERGLGHRTARAAMNVRMARAGTEAGGGDGMGPRLRDALSKTIDRGWQLVRPWWTDALLGIGLVLIGLLMAYIILLDR